LLSDIFEHQGTRPGGARSRSETGAKIDEHYTRWCQIDSVREG